MTSRSGIARASERHCALDAREQCSASTGVCSSKGLLSTLVSSAAQVDLVLAPTVAARVGAEHRGRLIVVWGFAYGAAKGKGGSDTARTVRMRRTCAAAKEQRPTIVFLEEAYGS